jgi:hypothetical protein
MVDLSWANGVYLQNLATHILSQVASSSSSKKELEHLWFHSFCEAQQVGIARRQGSCLCAFEPMHLVSCRGEEYTSGPHKD